MRLAASVWIGDVDYILTADVENGVGVVHVNAPDKAIILTLSTGVDGDFDEAADFIAALTVVAENARSL